MATATAVCRFVTYFPRERVEVPPTTRNARARGGQKLHALTRKISNKTRHICRESVLAVTYEVTLTFDPLTLNHVLAVTC